MLTALSKQTPQANLYITNILYTCNRVSMAAYFLFIKDCRTQIWTYIMQI